MNRKNMRKIAKIIAIIIVLILSRNLIFNTYSLLNKQLYRINDGLISIKSKIYTTASDYKRSSDVVNHIDIYVEEIENLRQDNALKNLELEELKGIRKENEELRKLLDLTKRNKDKYMVASIILVEAYREGYEAFIDRGYNDGITKYMPIMYNEYLLGYVNEVKENRSSIKLLTDDGVNTSILLNGNEKAILRGNGNGTFSIKGYNNDIDIDNYIYFTLETSGISNIYPKNMFIGRLNVIDKELFKNSNELKFKPNYNIHSINHILIKVK